MKTTLLIGGGGYVGSALVPELLNSGRKVKVLDTFWYGSKQFTQIRSEKLELVFADMRDTKSVADALSGVTEVIHLACISNDPSFDLNPTLGKSINLDSFLPLIELIKKSSVERFIYASSSSVYGVREEESITENLPLAPLTDYSRYKAMCEEIMLNEFNNDQVISILRPATVCGFSSRQRLDLVVNLLTAHAIVHNEIKVFGGSQFRPNLHIADMIDAYIAVLDAPDASINRQVFNVGSRNLTVKEIAEAVQATIDPALEIDFQATDDLRSYRVDSSKIKEKINFSPTRSVYDAIVEIRDNFHNFDSVNPLIDPRYINILRMKELKLA